MDRTRVATVEVAPAKSAGGGPQIGSALPSGYLLHDRYVIRETLGVGGFGITYLATHQYLEDKRVAIKEYLPRESAVRDETSRVHPISKRFDAVYSWGLKRFLEEAKFLREFKHDNIVKVEDFFKANETAYIVMDYIPGRSLHDDIDTDRLFDEEQLRNIVDPLVDALKLIHSKHIYHRDISPDNILLREEDDSPVLIDFGSARYEMRKREVQRMEEDNSSPPTAVVKHGYSPLEQYTGSPQGPYTDIYALGATLYHAAFGRRPIDAQNRASNIGLNKPDQLIPARDQGGERFSNGFLSAIDVALRIDPDKRPQSIGDWQVMFNSSGPRTQSKPDETSFIEKLKRSFVRIKDYVENHKWRKWSIQILLVAFLACSASYYWWITDKDATRLLKRATAIMEASPFEQSALIEANELYRDVLRQNESEASNNRAAAGLRAESLLQKFILAIHQKDSSDATLLIREVEAEFGDADIENSVLDFGWQQIDLLDKLAALRVAVRRAPLSSKSWPPIETLIAAIRTLPDGIAPAGKAAAGLDLLRRSSDHVSNQQFTEAHKNLANALELFRTFGIDSLDGATGYIEQESKQFEATRSKQIEALTVDAEAQLSAIPLTTTELASAIESYERILSLDSTHSDTLIRYTLAKKLANAYTEIEQHRYDAAGNILTAAREDVNGTEISDASIQQVSTMLDKHKAEWTTAQTRSEIHQSLALAARSLTNDPADQGAAKVAQNAYRNAITRSTNNTAFDAERAMAEYGIALAGALIQVENSLAERDYGGARKGLAKPEIGKWTIGVGLDAAFIGTIGRIINEREIVMIKQQVDDVLLTTGGITKDVLTNAQSHVDRILSIEPNNADAQAYGTGLKTLERFRSARAAHNYALAEEALTQSAREFPSEKITQQLLGHQQALVGKESALWSEQQQEARISALLQQAFEILSTQPFSSGARASADRIFDAVGSIKSGVERASAGRIVLSLLENAEDAMKKTRFGDALQAIGKAEQQLSVYGEYPLAHTRKNIEQEQERWEAERSAEIERLKQLAATRLRDNPPSREILKDTRTHFSAIAKVQNGGKLAEDGYALLETLEAYLDALDNFNFVQAQQLLENAQEHVRKIGFSPGVLQSATAAQTKKKIVTLLQLANKTLAESPLHVETQEKASGIYTEAFELDKSLKDSASASIEIAAGLETVILLKAFASEVDNQQFEAGRQTIGELRLTSRESRLDNGIIDQLTSVLATKEASWRVGLARDLIIEGKWFETKTLDPIQKQLATVSKIAPAYPELETLIKGTEDLGNVFIARNERDFDTALKYLSSANAAFDQVQLKPPSVRLLRAQLNAEKQRRDTLTIERTIASWTAQAMQSLEQHPFSKTNWKNVEGLVAKIVQVKPGDDRGVALQKSLVSLKDAETALSSETYAVALKHLHIARTSLTEIGLAEPLSNALQQIEKKAAQNYSKHQEAAAVILSKKIVSTDDFQKAETELYEILRIDEDHLVARIAIGAIRALQKAGSLSEETRYAEASRLLASAKKMTDENLEKEKPLPELRAIIDQAQQQVSGTRPHPNDIYPVVSSGLQMITEAPLDPDSLASAAELMRGVLEMQADEPSALTALQAIDQLRVARAAVDKNNAQAADLALAQAQQLLTTIGLDATSLQAAQRIIDQISP